MTRPHSSFAVAVAILCAACSSSTSSPSPPPPGVVPPGATNITLVLTNATVREAMTEFSRASGEPLAIDPVAESFVDCARVSLLSSGARPVADVAALLGEALGTQGFTLTRGASGWVLTQAGIVPTGCSAGRTRLPTTGPRAPAAPPAATGSVEHSETSVRRAELDEWLEDPGGLARMARVIPHTDDAGDIVGLRLFGIRRDSPMGELGFQNGDTVYTVNGYSVASAESALETYSRVRDADEFVVELDRRGQRLVHTIHVTD